MLFSSDSGRPCPGEGQLAVEEDLLLRRASVVNVHIGSFAFVLARLALVPGVLRTAFVEVLGLVDQQEIVDGNPVLIFHLRVLLLGNRLNVLNIEGLVARLHTLHLVPILHPFDIVFNIR